MLLEGQSEFEKLQSTTTDLRSCIKSIEWDLQDLDETISMLKLIIFDDIAVKYNIYYIYTCLNLFLSICYPTGIAEANPHKFRLSPGELQSRKQFITDTRMVVNVS